MRFFNWISEWVATLRIAPPFSRRRRELLAAIAEAEEMVCLGDGVCACGVCTWVQVERP